MQKILLAVDGSESCNKAVHKVAELAEYSHTEITVITVIEERLSLEGANSKDYVKREFERFEEMEHEGRDIAENCAKIFKDIAEMNTITKQGNPAAQICKEAKSYDYDFVVVADKGKGDLKKFFLGSTAERVVRHCEKTVMVVK